ANRSVLMALRNFIATSTKQFRTMELYQSDGENGLGFFEAPKYGTPTKNAPTKIHVPWPFYTPTQIMQWFYNTKVDHTSCDTNSLQFSYGSVGPINLPLYVLPRDNRLKDCGTIVRAVFNFYQDTMLLWGYSIVLFDSTILVTDPVLGKRSLAEREKKKKYEDTSNQKRNADL
ncbi:MAG: hypothetical protein FWD50_00305, partial [Betaproteobacteria bacterium]|nr:hypothetical protein [Betaproteobacteria bacterium]